MTLKLILLIYSTLAKDHYYNNISSMIFSQLIDKYNINELSNYSAERSIYRNSFNA